MRLSAIKKVKYFILFLIIATLLFPLYWLFVGSLQDIRGLYAMPPRFLPLYPTLQNYETLLANTPILLWTGNTMILVSVTAILSVGTTMLAAYAISVFRFPGRRILWWLFLTSLMLPRQSLIIPLFVIIRKIGLSGSRFGAVLPLIFSAFHILLFRLFVDRLPREMIDSARMDGASEIVIILRITLPLCRPIVGALLLFKTVETMGDFLWQSLVLQDAGKKTLLVGLLQAVRQHGGDAWANINPLGLAMSAATLLFLPLLLIFVFSSRYFVSGIMAGGIKE